VRQKVVRWQCCFAGTRFGEALDQVATVRRKALKGLAFTFSEMRSPRRSQNRIHALVPGKRSRGDERSETTETERGPQRGGAAGDLGDFTVESVPLFKKFLDISSGTNVISQVTKVTQPSDPKPSKASRPHVPGVP
jgi:hypothetical protein